MADQNDFNKPDLASNYQTEVLETLRAHIRRAFCWDGSAASNLFSGMIRGVFASVTGGLSLRLFRRNSGNTGEDEVVSLPNVSIGGDAATVATYGVTTGTAASKIPVRDSNGKLPGDITGNAATSSSCSGNAATSSSCSGNAASASQVAWSGVTGKPTGPTIAGTWDWTLQSGQQYVWGSSDGVTFQKYNPANFSVNRAGYADSTNWATSAGNADTVDGYHASQLAKPGSVAVLQYLGFFQYAVDAYANWGSGIYISRASYSGGDGVFSVDSSYRTVQVHPDNGSNVYRVLNG